MSILDVVFGSKKVENKKETIRDLTIRTLTKRVNEYTEWNAQHGLYLPPDFTTDPSGWINTLRDIQRAFNLLNDELDEEGELWEAKTKWAKYGEKDAEAIEDLNKEVRRGLSLFGKYLFDLADDTIKSETDGK